MYTSRRLWPATALAVGALLLAACSSSGSAPAATGSSGAAPAATGSSGAAPAAAGVPQAVIDNVVASQALPTFEALGEPFSIADVKGKKIFEIPSVPNPFLQSISDSMKQAAEAAGKRRAQIGDEQAELAAQEATERDATARLAAELAEYLVATL